MDQMKCKDCIYFSNYVCERHCTRVFASNSICESFFRKSKPPVKVEDLMDMRFGDVVDNFCILMSLECDYFYGISSFDDVKEVVDEYELDDEPSFFADFLINYFPQWETDKKLLSADDMRRILGNLGIKKKNKSEETDLNQ